MLSCIRICAACAALLIAPPTLAQGSLASAFAWLSAGAGAPAQAQARSASANVQVDGFTHQLIDLDPSDGITPAISFTEVAESVSFFAGDGDPGENHDIRGFGNTAVRRPFGSATTASSGADSSAEASWTGSASHFQQFVAQVAYTWHFSLTPSTGLLLSAAASVEAAHDEVTLAVAQAWMYGYGNRPDWEIEQDEFSDRIRINQGQRDYQLSGYLASGPQAGGGTFTIWTYADARSMRPVPEPAGWTMLLAALALLGRRIRMQPGTVRSARSARSARAIVQPPACGSTAQ